ncbi:hypothetical protein GCM10027035_17810 [Emticicia sediminis]
MGFWDFFKKKEQSKTSPSQKSWVTLGPAYLEGLTIQSSFKNTPKVFEWRRQLATLTGETKFKIKYYGQLHPKYKELIIDTDFAPSLIFAVSPTTQNEILIFDGCKHGYNAIFCDTFTTGQIKKRKAENYYIDKEGNDTFEIVISAYYQIDYDSEKEDFIENIDNNGLIELENGSKVDFEVVKRNGFDFLQILAITNNGKEIEILSEELS